TARLGMTQKFTTPAANWDGHCGRPNGRPLRRVITWSLYVPPTARVTRKNGKPIAGHSLGVRGFITLLWRLRRRMAGVLHSRGAVLVLTERRYSSSSRAVQLAPCARFYRWRK